MSARSASMMATLLFECETQNASGSARRKALTQAEIAPSEWIAYRQHVNVSFETRI